MTLSQSIFQLDYNTNRLLYLFKSNKYETLDFDELSWMISQLNEYQFLYLLDNIDLNKAFSKKYIKLFLSFIYEEKSENFRLYEDYQINCNIENSDISLSLKKYLTGVGFNYKKTELPTANCIKPEEGIIELLGYEKMLNKKNIPLVNSIREKLSKIDSSIFPSEITFLEMNFISEDEYGYPVGDHGSCLYGSEDSKYNKIDIIRNEFYLNFDFIYFWITNSHSSELIKKESNKLRTFNFNYLNKELDGRLQIVFPLVFSLNSWKELLIKKMSGCKDDLEFQKTKKLFKNSLKELILINNSEYLTHRYMENPEEFNIVETTVYDEVIEDYITYDNFGELKRQSNDILIASQTSDINKMLGWIENSFISIENIKIDEVVKFNDNISIENKLILSYKMNQTKLLHILIKYFEVYEIEYDLEVLKSLIYHFTTIEKKENKKQGYNSKFIGYVRLKWVDFIPENHTSNIIKIFLKLLDRNIIKTGINQTFRIIELMFSKNQVKGFSKDSAKTYWKKKGDKAENLKVDNLIFWSFFLRQLPKID